MTTQIKSLMAFNGDSNIKTERTASVEEHQRLDQIVQAHGGWRQSQRGGVFLGDAVGCTIHSNDHYAYEKELGIPVHLAYLKGAIFEAIALQVARLFPLKFLQAIPVGADLSMVINYLMLWILTDEVYGVINFTGDNEQVTGIIRTVVELYKLRIVGDEPTGQVWISSRSAARGASHIATTHATTSMDPAYVICSKAADVADSATYVSTYAAVRTIAFAASVYKLSKHPYSTAVKQEYYKAVHDKLLELLAAAPPHVDYKAAA